MKPEARLSCQIASWSRAWLPDDVYATAIPGGGWGPVTGKRWKDMGYRAGTLDWLILHAGRAHLVELKAQSGSLTSSQRGAIPHLRYAGAEVAIVRSLSEWKAALQGWGIFPMHHPRAEPGLDDEVPW